MLDGTLPKTQAKVCAPGIEISEPLIRRFDSLGPRYTSYPTADRFHDRFDEAAYIGHLQARVNDHARPPLSVYVHLPFCASLCYYCACNKIITKDHGRSAKYLRYLAKELALLAPHLGGRQRCVQLHLGGGTPTFLNDDELAQLMEMLHQHFDFAPDAEIAIEIDPRTVRPGMLAKLAALGFNRTSLGVQDFDPDVQQTIHRVQPVEMVEQAVNQSRAAGFASINFDLIYGLPKQNVASFTQTLDQVIRLSPERIALYNYAHLPSRFKAQRRIGDHTLPSAEERLQIFMLSLKRLLDAGYVYIGLDHFAKPDDELAQAMARRELHRNFQGYTTHAECDMIAIGLSSISKVGASYSQSVRTLDEYYAKLDEGQLPLEKGYSLSPDDVLRRRVMMDLMCSGPLDFAAIGREFGIVVNDYFAAELARLAPYAVEGLLEIKPDGITILPRGRMFVRAFAMVFDRFLALPGKAQYSKLI
jgi:oxygen-independent coproporphyrinogen-3 oxidase